MATTPRPRQNHTAPKPVGPTFQPEHHLPVRKPALHFRPHQPAARLFTFPNFCQRRQPQGRVEPACIRVKFAVSEIKLLPLRVNHYAEITAARVDNSAPACIAGRSALLMPSNLTPHASCQPCASAIAARIPVFMSPARCPTAIPFDFLAFQPRLAQHRFRSARTASLCGRWSYPPLQR